jgi:uncharacterized SAM-binding protein YcdF (DUF218 family)
MNQRPPSLPPVARPSLSATPPPRFNRWQMMGGDGLVTLLLSNLLIVATLGLSWLWQCGRVYRIARDAPTDGVDGDLIMVLGRRLRRDQVSAEYAARLDRARHLYRQGGPRQILIVGGHTRGNRTSEAEQGRAYLQRGGVPAEQLLTEDRSRHTLENLHHARQTLGPRRQAPLVLVTSRYHLARSQVLAQGLGLQPRLCAAEARLGHDPGTWLRLLREAYYLHWYAVGKTWSRWTGNAASLARIH